MKRYFIILLLAVTSCNDKISQEDIQVIEKIELGRDANTWVQQLDSLHVPTDEFYSKPLFFSSLECCNEAYQIPMFYTRTFDRPEYANQETHHYGHLQQIILEGTRNNLGLIVLLCHTANPVLVGEAKTFKALFDKRVINYEMNELLLNQIEKLYIEKYGEPKRTISSVGEVWTFEKRATRSFINDGKRKGEYLEWHTKYIDITFFKGLPSYYESYNKVDQGYNRAISILGDGLQEIVTPRIAKGEVASYTYPYIKYVLNTNAIKRLSLNKKAI